MFPQEFLLLGLAVLLTLILGVFFYRLFRRIKHEETPAPLQSSANEITDKILVPAEDEIKIESEQSLKQALSNTEKNLFGRIKNLFIGGPQQNPLSEIEEILYTSDLGPQTVESLMDSVRNQLSRTELANADLVKEILKNQFTEIFQRVEGVGPDAHADGNSTATELYGSLKLNETPTVLMVVGVNGAGKTTSIGKIAANLSGSGKKVLVAAGDTFRAAAESQLKVWTERAQVDIFSPPNVTDPSAVAYEAVAKGKAQNYDVVIVDTAGRLHTQANLMEELKKMKRVLAKVMPSAPHETWIVLDANSGQNALHQAREFHQAIGLTGVVLTKLDGSAKGGVAVGLANELKIPIRLIGVGEKIADLRPFSAKEFIDSIL